MHARLSVLLGSGGAKSSDTIPTLDWILGGINFELQRRGLWKVGAYFPVTQLVPECDVASKAVCEQLLSEMHGPATPTLLTVLGQLAGRCLADYLLMQRIPVGPKTMLAQLSQIPLAIEEAFPGYMEAGMLRLCVVGLAKSDG